MKRIIAIALFTISTFCASTGILAQEQGLEVKIPFEFALGDKLLPADTYTVTSPMHGFVLIQSIDKHFAAMAIASHMNNETTGDSKLVFAKYSDQYFLHQILCPTSVAMNVGLPTSKTEKRVRTERPRGERGELALAALK
jgi:hypothetical protein